MASFSSQSELPVLGCTRIFATEGAFNEVPEINSTLNQPQSGWCSAAVVQCSGENIGGN